MSAEWRRALRCGAAVLGLACGAAIADEPAKDRVVLVKSENPDMLRAMAHARATLDGFLALAAKPPAGATGFRLKVRFSEGSQVEHMWVDDFVATPHGFSGKLTNEPEYVHGLVFGQRVEFVRADISDWGYQTAGKQKGSFTACAMFKQMPPAEVQQYVHDYGFDCNAPDERF